MLQYTHRQMTKAHTFDQKGTRSNGKDTLPLQV